jgi:Concanavalin A-like lectin/glucanases superfamily/PKD domain
MTLAAGVAIALPQAPKAHADTAPPAGTPATVSTDPLPTWQIDGVVWDETTVGNTVYAVGSFTEARPPGTPAGSSQQVARANILAFDITTGNLITSFNHSLNAQGLRVVASPDGSRIYVGGDFTTVDGQTRNHIAAFDTATGALDTSFHPSVSSRIRGIAVSNTSVYYGGNFFNVNGVARTRLAASTASNGALLPWAPTADDNEVFAMVMAPDQSRVIIGGRFQSFNGQPHSDIAAADPTTGGTATWNSTPEPVSQGSSWSYVTSLTTDGKNIYAGSDGEGGHWFDGRWAADPDTGNLIWLDNCYGATYGIYPTGQVLYSVSHAHDCTSMGTFPQANPAAWHHGLAETIYPTGIDQGAPGSNMTVSHQPIPTQLHWYPTLTDGTFTGQDQAAWAVTGNGNYIALGGEFPTVNGGAQQGLVRYAVSSIAPNKVGPVGSTTLTPTATALGDGAIRIAWQATWDQDNAKLRYDILRDGGSTPVGSVSASSDFWDLQNLGFLDTTAAPGTAHTYRVRAVDPFGNTAGSGTSNSVTAPTGSLGAYGKAVLSDGAADYWRLGESSGNTAFNYASGNDATEGSGVSDGQTGAISGDADTAAKFSGGSSGTATTMATEPAPTNFTAEAWIKTTTHSGGKIIGYGDSTGQTSSNYDRHIYMDNSGHIWFGVYPGQVKTVESPNTYNDGQWHQVVATLDSAAGMVLYVDGHQVGSDPSTTSAQAYTGYWHLGGDTLNGWSSQPSSQDFNGTIDEAAVYPTALSANQVSRHYGIGTGALSGNPPTAVFTSTCTALTCTFDGSSSSEQGGTISSYAWDFGDGTAGTGATPSHTYTAGGTYNVKLTVTDNGGATAAVTNPVSAQAPTSTLAKDTFARTVTNGLGTADTGGAWTLIGPATDFSVNGTAGKILLPAATKGPGGDLNDVSSTNTDETFSIATDKIGTGNGVYVYAVGRHIIGTGDYRAQVRMKADGTVGVQLIRTDSTGASTTLGAEQTVSGLTYAPGTVLDVRMQTIGTSPTTVQARVWADGTTEPTTWQVSTTDSTSALQAAGSVGFLTYLAGGATNAPVTVTLDGFTVIDPTTGPHAKVKTSKVTAKAKTAKAKTAKAKTAKAKATKSTKGRSTKAH